MKYEVVKSETMIGFWRVVANDYDVLGGNGYIAIFGGDNAEARAREYATWKNVFAGGSKGGVNGGLFRQ